ncbi:MAG TPA: YceI family protein [Acidimicrobiales bacterium]|nr:YceI family protein [Acidimicrobiales bacterium]
MAETTTTELVRTHGGRQVPVPGTYTLDRAHSAVEFVARHLMISKVRGRFADFDGRIDIAEVPEESSVQVTIQTTSVFTDEASRDGHLRGADFFDTEQFPLIEFRSTRVEPQSSDSWKVQGDLTIRDVTRPVTLTVDFEGATRTPWGQDRVGFSAATELDREDWGLTWNQALETGGVVVGKKVRVELTVEAVRSDSGDGA